MDKSLAIGQELEKIIKDVADVALVMWELGWAESHAGNISVNVTEHIPEDIGELSRFLSREIDKSYPELSGFSFFITVAGARMRDLAKKPAENAFILRLAEKGNRYHILWGKRLGSDFKSTSELHSHLSIHRLLLSKKAPQKAIVHAHPTELVALTQVKEYKQENKLNLLLWSMNPEAKIVIEKGIGLVPYHAPGSDELAQATVKALEKHDVVLWEKHGCLAIGKEVLETLDQIDVLNKAARIFFMCKGAGLEPEGLSAGQLAELESLFSSKK
jgi:rhamnulose-1-phosphate aldolase